MSELHSRLNNILSDVQSLMRINYKLNKEILELKKELSEIKLRVKDGANNAIDAKDSEKNYKLLKEEIDGCLKEVTATIEIAKSLK